MWAKLIEIVEVRAADKNLRPRQRMAKAVNSLYGAMNNCQVAFVRNENDHTEVSFVNFVFAIDALLATLHNLHAQLEIFEPDLADRLEQYALGSRRIADMARPRDLVKSQLKLLRELVRMEASVKVLPVEEFGSFSGAMERLGRFIKGNFTLEELFGPQ